MSVINELICICGSQKLNYDFTLTKTWRRKGRFE